MAEYNNQCLQMKIDKIEEILVKCESCGAKINPFTNKFCGQCGVENDHYIKMDTPEEIRNEWELREKQNTENLNKMVEKFKELFKESAK